MRNSRSSSTRVTVQGRPSLSSVTRSTSASAGSSSRYRIRNGAFTRSCITGFLTRLRLLYGSWWRLIDDGPEEPELLDGVHEFLELHRLDDVGVDAESIARDHVSFFARGCEHHDGNHS